MPTPYTVSASSITPINTAQSYAITQATAVGDTIVAAFGGNGPAITAFGDSKGNTYTHLINATTSPVLHVYYCLRAPNALALTDTFTVTHGGSGAAGESLIVRACPGCTALGVSPAFVAATTGSPSIASGAFTGYDQWLFASLATTNGGGSPSAPTNGFVFQSTQHPGSNQYLSVAEQVYNGPASITFGCTITSVAETVSLISFLAPAVIPSQLRRAPVRRHGSVRPLPAYMR